MERRPAATRVEGQAMAPVERRVAVGVVGQGAVPVERRVAVRVEGRVAVGVVGQAATTRWTVGAGTCTAHCSSLATKSRAWSGQW
ncbi:hypothetical protein GCM10022226_59480 [Sphaerisporangium flaviroseum]|uniref:Uncharacterized protein n=1 Tax=Sphaerisporangium flaviroseum TaxID=509199 RepID=A0ABP7IZM5_9ACTN